MTMNDASRLAMPIADRTFLDDGGAPAEKPKKSKKRDVHGWIVLDKPIGMTSTYAVAVIKRLFAAKRVGHAGTLDPLASGCLPIALGEATKTVPFVFDGRKTYRFTIRWGEERDTDDAEGRVAATSTIRPDAAAIRAQLPRFTGTIDQVPPRFSAIKIDGERAYDLARDGEAVELKPRTVEIYRLELLETPDPDHAVLAAECGKGTYVRAIARDLGRALGALGHVSALRRDRVGPFGEDEMISLEQLETLCHRAAAGEQNLGRAPADRDRAGRHPGAGREFGRCGKAPEGPSRFVARTGRCHFPRHCCSHLRRRNRGHRRNRPRRNRPQARVQFDRHRWSSRRKG